MSRTPVKSPSAFRGKMGKDIGNVDRSFGRFLRDTEHLAQIGTDRVDVNRYSITL